MQLINVTLNLTKVSKKYCHRQKEKDIQPISITNYSILLIWSEILATDLSDDG